MSAMKKIKRAIRICRVYITVYRVGPALVIGGLVCAALGSAITWSSVGRFYPGKRDFAREVFEFGIKGIL